MTVGILGSTELDFDINALYRYIRNCASPHIVDCIVTTDRYGVPESARMMAKEKNISLMVIDGVQKSSREQWEQVIDNAQMTVILRKSDEWPYEARYCGEKGRPFKEYVVETKKDKQ